MLGLDHHTDYLSPLRSHLNSLSTPFYWLSNIPQRMIRWVDINISSRQQLIIENRRLHGKALMQKALLQKMSALSSENNRLRALMNASELLEDKVLVAELVGISPDPKIHKVVVNKGNVDGVYIGQAVLDEFGLIGQTVSVTYNTAEVLFITDDSHAIPVRISRNNVRTVVEGIGNLFKLSLRYVPSTMDIIEGDMLVSSGLGGRFPPGYPVAMVKSIRHDPGKSFTSVDVIPTAHLDRSRYVLLVFHKHDVEIRNSEPER